MSVVAGEWVAMLCTVKSCTYEKRAFLEWNMLYTVKSTKEKKVLGVIPRVGNRLLSTIGKS